MLRKLCKVCRTAKPDVTYTATSCSESHSYTTPMSSPTPQAPSRQKGLITHESPVRAKAVHSSHSYQNGLLEDARLAVLQDLGTSIPEIPLQTFIAFLTPPKPQFYICVPVNALKSESILSASGRWSAFDKEPKDQLGHENDVFKPMTNIFTKVVNAIIKHSDLTDSRCSIDFLQNPNSAPKSAERHTATKPDGYLLVKDRLEQGVVSWADVVLSCEYKKEGGDEQLDDVRLTQKHRYHVMLMYHVRTCASACGACSTSCGTILVAEPHSA